MKARPDWELRSMRGEGLMGVLLGAGFGLGGAELQEPIVVFCGLVIFAAAAFSYIAGITLPRAIR